MFLCEGGCDADVASEYLTWQIQWNPRGWCSCKPTRNQLASWSGLCRRTPSPWCRWWWSSQSLLAVWDICSSGEESLQSNNVFFLLLSTVKFSMKISKNVFIDWGLHRCAALKWNVRQYYPQIVFNCNTFNFQKKRENIVRNKVCYKNRDKTSTKL